MNGNTMRRHPNWNVSMAGPYPEWNNEPPTDGCDRISTCAAHLRNITPMLRLLLILNWLQLRRDLYVNIVLI